MEAIVRLSLVREVEKSGCRSKDGMLKMKALILNGSNKDDQTSETVQRVIIDELRGLKWEVKPLILREMEIAPCMGCFGCWVQTPGTCVIDDMGRGIARSFIQSDLAILLTPVTFGGYSSELKKGLDRSIGLIMPFFTKIEGEVHHKPRYKKYPSLMGIGVLSKKDEESERIFKTLVQRNAINFHAPASAAGIVLGGSSADDIQRAIGDLFLSLGVKR